MVITDYVETWSYDLAYESGKLIINFGGDLVPDTHSGWLTTSLTIAEYGIQDIC